MNVITTSFEEWIKFVDFEEEEDIYHLYLAALYRQHAGQFNCEEKGEELIITNLLLPEKQLVLKGGGIDYFPLWLNGYFAAKTHGENIEDWGKFNEELSKED